MSFDSMSLVHPTLEVVMKNTLNRWRHAASHHKKKAEEWAGHAKRCKSDRKDSFCRVFMKLYHSNMQMYQYYMGLVDKYSSKHL